MSSGKRWKWHFRDPNINLKILWAANPQQTPPPPPPPPHTHTHTSLGLATFRAEFQFPIQYM